MKRRKVYKIAMTLGLALWLAGAGSAGASTLVPQTALPGDCVPRFATPLPVFGPAGPIPRVNASQYPKLQINMKEASQQVFPTGVFSCTVGGVTSDYDLSTTPTRIWGYEIKDALTGKLLGPTHWPAVTVESRRYIPNTVTYVNELPAFDGNNPYGPGLVQGLVTVDKTIDWADPLSTNCGIDPTGVDCFTPFVGSPPAVPHLHGAEVSSRFDGGPLAWFTSAGATGAQYSSLAPAGPGKAIYAYPNQQEPGTLWFHDHAMGMTRTNVYSGLAAFYFLRDPVAEPKNLPTGAYEVEIAIQDRQFDTTGQLYFPDGSGTDAATSNLNGTPPNPDVHPFWNPEFIGDVAIVNGAPWPYFDVQPRRYRIRIIEGSNARFYNMQLKTTDAAPALVPVFAIGSDGNYLNVPADVTNTGVFIAPGERADIIVDFTGLAGKTVEVTNDARVPYPSGLLPGAGGDQPQMGSIMRFRVNKPLAGSDTSCNPATGGCTRPKPIVRLTDGNGNLALGVKIDKVRRLILKEIQGAGGPVMVTVNNSLFDGKMSPSIAAEFPVDGVSELPRQGATELWEIVNLTMDAHPMHTHLTQFQVLNRQDYDTDGTLGSGIPGGYFAAWEGAFGTGPVPLPAGCVPGQFCPGYGPPLPYNTPIAGAVGGNPDVAPYLLSGPGNITSPRPEESGWKDTAKAFPGQVMRMVVRFTPTSTPVQFNKSLAGRNFFPFDPTEGSGYVWHCHIIDHEDQDMMRPYKVQK